MIAYHGKALPLSYIPHRMRVRRQAEAAAVHPVRHGNVATRVVTGMVRAGEWRHSVTTTAYILALVGAAGLIALSVNGLADDPRVELSRWQVRRVLKSMCDRGLIVRTWRGTKDGGASRFALGAEYLRVAGRDLLKQFPDLPRFDARGVVTTHAQTQHAMTAPTVQFKYEPRGHPDDQPFTVIVERGPEGHDRPVRTAAEGLPNGRACPPGPTPARGDPLGAARAGFTALRAKLGRPRPPAGVPSCAQSTTEQADDRGPTTDPPFLVSPE
jgi:hypothetical protein